MKRITTKTYTTDPYQYHGYIGGELAYLGNTSESRKDVQTATKRLAEKHNRRCRNCGCEYSDNIHEHGCPFCGSTNNTGIND